MLVCLNICKVSYQNKKHYSLSNEMDDYSMIVGGVVYGGMCIYPNVFTENGLLTRSKSNCEHRRKSRERLKK